MRRGGGAAAAEMVVVAGAGAGAQPSSPQPSASTAASFSTAAAASGPLATTCTFAPCDTSSPMIAVTLRALACRSPNWSLMTDWKLFARFASTAAGRACRPVGFGITTASDVIVVAAAADAAPPLRREGHREQRVLPGRHVAAGAFPRRHALAVGDDDLGQQALGVGGKEIEIERDQRRAGPHLVAEFHARVESFALQRHRVDADVHQHLEPSGVRSGHRMAGGGKRHDLAVTAATSTRVGGIDRQAVADHLLREDRIGDALQRPDLSGQRRQNLELGRRRLVELSHESPPGRSLSPRSVC